MSNFDQTRPHFSEAQAAHIAQTHFNVSGPIRQLPSERDQNFLITVSPDEQVVLKIANSQEETAVLDLQTQAMLHLAAHNPAAHPYRLYPSTSGEIMLPIADNNGNRYLTRLINFIPGTLLAHVNPQTPDLLHSFGKLLAETDKALADFSHPAAERDLHWDLRQAPAMIRGYFAHIPTDERQALVQRFLGLAAREVQEEGLRTAVIHNDANDHNVLVSPDPRQPRTVTGLIDFGDMLHSYLIAELAIATAYIMMDKDDPLAAAAHVVAGYHAAYPLHEAEIAALFPLIALRLCSSVAHSSYRAAVEPHDPYQIIHQQKAWHLLEKLVAIPPNLAHYRLRHACGLPPCPQTETIVNWIKANPDKISPVVDLDLATVPKLVFDLSVGSPLLGNLNTPMDTATFTQKAFAEMEAAGAVVGIGRYNEPRKIYADPMFLTQTDPSADPTLAEWRTIHIGLDLFMGAGTAVHAALDGVVHAFHNNAAAFDYGPVIILEHKTDDGTPFYTLYGHLSLSSLDNLRVGIHVEQGQPIAWMGDYPINGDWPPHLHFQLITDLLDMGVDYPGVALASQRDVWLSLNPDPNLLCGIPPSCFPAPLPSHAELIAQRQQRLGKMLSVSYAKPLKIVRGIGQYLYDDTGRAYLDVVNNVAHVGHCHPHVTQALTNQANVLNTNTRYLHDHIIEYAKRLAATFPDPLSVCFFVCSGTEANELALRLARTYTGQRDMVVVDVAYHGNSNAIIDISPYKFNAPGGQGKPPHTHIAPMPDPYRGQYKGYGRDAGRAYAQHIQPLIDEVQAAGRGIAGFIAESVLGCGGQIVLPDGYLEEAYRLVRQAGGVCIADEVQVGFGRVGSHFWGFETQGVIPDIVTMGKPIGNGHPLGAVITTPEIAEAFNNGMEYFNTFGGNPVSCAVGLAVLDVIEQEDLQGNALRVGQRLLEGLTGLMDKHPIIGDVRGLGLFVGIELVRDRATLEPAAAEARYVVDRMKEHGILLSTDGPYHNVLKLKPPIVFSEANADVLVHTLDKIFAEDFVKIM
ncbi:MAG: aminotransferase class III-fold pyridoxal phosphate-dependent enzyme [Ardenticatenaceae bacterium]|nr:aminotransferase class III-fold pyridoxal phosphate-dependent enzyme [Ardenticatenaceae bacterium]